MAQRPKYTDAEIVRAIEIWRDATPPKFGDDDQIRAARLLEETGLLSHLEHHIQPKTRRVRSGAPSDSERQMSFDFAL